MTNFPNEQRCKSSHKVLVNQIEKQIKNIIHHDQVGLITDSRAGSTYIKGQIKSNRLKKTEK